MNFPYRFSLRLFTLLLLYLTCPRQPLSAQPASEALPDSLDIKIGQMLMIGFRGLRIDAQSPIVRDIKKRHIGGVILFDYDVPSHSPVRNIRSAQQVRRLTGDLQRFASTPLFVAIDQEGGKVSRLKPKFGFPPTVTQEYLGKLDNPDSTRFYANRTAAQLEKLGINLDFAPDVDLNINPRNPIIGALGRSYSAEPDVVIRNAALTIRAFHRHRILSVIKHFPGHGSSQNDSHLGVVDVTQTWRHQELKPFEALIDSQLVDMVMTAHIFNARLDSSYPATLSRPVITGLLRDSLDYRGVVVSDDLQMGAIRSEYGLEATIQHVLDAGVDILLFANNSVFDEDIASRAFNIIHRLVACGRISPERIDRSYQKILRLKKRL